MEARKVRVMGVAVKLMFHALDLWSLKSEREHLG